MTTSGSSSKDPSAERLRTFIALRPSPRQRRAIEALVERLALVMGEPRPRDDAPAKERLVRWVPPNQYHLTLAFLGDVPRAALAPLAARLRSAAGRSAPFDLAFRGLGAFPSTRRPNVVWLGVGTGRRPSTALAEEVRNELLAKHVPYDDRPFRPHLTLGRVRRRARRGDAANATWEAALARSPADTDSGTARIDEVALTTSRLRASGPEHTIVARARLGDGGRGTR